MSKKIQSKDDYIIRFQFSDLETNDIDSDPLVGMIQQYLIDLQKIGNLCIGNQRVTIDGFILNNDTSKVYKLKKQ